MVVGFCADEPFKLQGTDKKVAFFNSTDLQLELVPGSGFPKTFVLEIGGCKMDIEASLNAPKIDFKVSVAGAYQFTATNPSGIKVDSQVVFSGSSGGTVAGCPVKFNQVDGGFTVPIELSGGVPSDLILSSKSAWIYDSSGGATTPATSKGLATGAIIGIVVAVVVVIALIAGGVVGFIFYRKRRLAKGQDESRDVDNEEGGPEAPEKKAGAAKTVGDSKKATNVSNK